MKVYKQKVRSKRELLTELGFVTWQNRQDVTSLLTIIAKRVSEIRFDNIIHSIILKYTLKNFGYILQEFISRIIKCFKVSILNISYFN